MKGRAIVSLGKNSMDKPSVKRWGIYFIEALVLLGLLYLTSKELPSLPPLAIALMWALASGAATIGAAYHTVVKKLHNSYLYQEGGRLSRINAGRLFRITISFVVSAICIASLFIACPTWGKAEWCLAILAVPLFFFVSLIVEKWANREYTQEFRRSYAVRISTIVTCGLLCIASLLLLSMQQQPQYANAAEAYLAAAHPFANSSSALLSEIGEILSLSGWLTDYMLSITGESFPFGLLVMRCIVLASALFGLARLLGSCSLEWGELKKVFTPFKNDSNKTPTTAWLNKYVAVFVVLSTCLVPIYLVADNKMAGIAQTEEHSIAERIIHDQVNLLVYEVDGKYLNASLVDSLLQETQQKGTALNSKAEDELAKLINKVFDKRKENVEDYLEWYYSLPADYELLWNVVTNNAEEFAEQQFVERIDNGVQDYIDRFEQEYDAYIGQVETLEAEYDSLLDQCEIKDAPEWMLTVSNSSMNSEKLRIEALAPSKELLTAGERIGISAAAGAGASLVASRVIGKAVSKQVFKKMSGTVVSKVAAVGGPAGIAVSVGVQYLLLKIDEALNRSEHEEAIYNEIETQRAEMLTLLGLKE